MQREDTKQNLGENSSPVVPGLMQMGLCWVREGQRHRRSDIFQDWYRQMEGYENKEIGSSFIMDQGMGSRQETPFALCCYHPDTVCCSYAQQTGELSESLTCRSSIAA